MKYSSVTGILASALLIVACFVPWTYYPDIQQQFNGFHSQDNIYGKPGYLFFIFAIICIFLFAMPRVWAKRTNWLIATLTVAYTVKTYFLFTSCYSGICPLKLSGIYLLMGSVAVMFVCAILPDLKIKS